jgi:hypothetical protein
MSNVLEKVKELVNNGKYVFLVDTMNEIDGKDLVTNSISQDQVSIFRFATYEECKLFLFKVNQEVPSDRRPDMAIVINNIAALISEKQKSIMDELRQIEANPLSHNQGKLEIDATRNLRRENLFMSRKKFRELVFAIKEIQNAGIEIHVVEGMEPPCPLEVYRVFGSMDEKKYRDEYQGFVPED